MTYPYKRVGEGATFDNNIHDVIDNAKVNQLRYTLNLLYDENPMLKPRIATLLTEPIPTKYLDWWKFVSPQSNPPSKENANPTPLQETDGNRRHASSITPVPDEKVLVEKESRKQDIVSLLSDGEDAMPVQAPKPQNQVHTPSGLKRKFQQNAVCKNCDEQFDPMASVDGECVYHSCKNCALTHSSARLILYALGDLEPNWDDDFWADTDPDLHDCSPEGSMASMSKYMYSCCEEDGNAKGCEAGRHIARGSKKIKFNQHR
jgi:hypothetical protein